MARLNALLGPQAGARAAQLKALVLPAFVVMMLAMMVLPLPAFVLAQSVGSIDCNRCNSAFMSG